MVNKFINATTVALHSVFGDDAAYYLEEVEQNVKKPCFVVRTISPTIRSINARSYYRSIPFVIHYFTNEPSTSTARKDCYEKAEKLMEALEYLTVEDCIFRGENIEWEIVEGVLQFYITYRLVVYKEIEETFMEQGELNGVPI